MLDVLADPHSGMPYVHIGWDCHHEHLLPPSKLFSFINHTTATRVKCGQNKMCVWSYLEKGPRHVCIRYLHKKHEAEAYRRGHICLSIYLSACYCSERSGGNSIYR
jgi:hypothetical protein